MLIGTEIEYAPTCVNIPGVGPIFLSGALVSSFLGVPLPTGEPAFDGAWLESLAVEGTESTPRVPGVVSGHYAGLPSAFLGNGARMYVDHAHPEYSTPECASPLQATVAEYAGDLMMYEATRLAVANLSSDFPDANIRLFKSNSDGKGNSWGAHENYLLPRAIPWSYVERAMLPYFVTRQIMVGAGKVGVEHGRPETGFQVAQRSDFFEQPISLTTTHARGIMNTRDEPHADPEQFRRLHVITGDANRSPYATWLKLGTTALTLLAMSSHAMEPLKHWVALADPVRAIWRVSHDVNLSRTIQLDSGGTTTALDIQELYYETACRYANSHQTPPWVPAVLDAWLFVLEGLQMDPMRLVDRVDWLAKYRVLRDADIPLNSSKAKAVDHIYHELGPTGIATKMIDSGALIFPPGFTVDDVDAAKTVPPPTRAAVRGGAIAADASVWAEMNWSYGVLTSGERVEFPLL